MDIIISPSLLSADFLNLKKDIEIINNSKADWFHLDIMDGVFVPNISFGFPVIKSIKKLAKKPLDVHLMIIEPDRYLNDFKNAGADILTVHAEACNHLNRTINAIKNLGMKAGVSINPHTPVNILENIIDDLDLVLIMSVNPGFGGQKFIEKTYDKIRQIKSISKNNNLIIEVDGGVDNTNAKKLVNSGANALVAGSFIFKSNNKTQTILDLKNLNF